jgi:2-(1,2-epoxy-1,2-dihydrophenyl)acetyl-CoA isomerase
MTDALTASAPLTLADGKVLADRIGPVLRVTFNDPATLNAATLQIAEAMIGLLTDGLGDARAVLLTGTGRGFCSGANLAGGVVGDDPAGPDAGAALDSHYNPLVRVLRDLPVPLVTAVNGAAAGVGCSLALMGDMILAAESAYFLQAFRRIGLVPDGGSSYMLARAIGKARAMEMMLMGEKLPAAQALSWGLINRVVPDGALADEALSLATALAQGPTRTLAMIRKMAWAGLDNGWEEQLELERTLQRQAGRTRDSMEGVIAFLQKRPANFTGE